MNNFIKFIKYPDQYFSNDFLINNKKVINNLNKIKLKKCSFKKDKLEFKNESYQKLYDSSPGFPKIKNILNNPDKNYIIMGGIRTVGARYPDYIINKNDILYLKDVMDRYGIMKIPISNIKKVIEKCIELIQEKLKTYLFNDIEKSRWLLFDKITNNFRNTCLNSNSYSKLKKNFICTNLSFLLYFIGDCRECSLLLLYFIRIYLYYNDTNKTYLVTPIYTSFGYFDTKFINEMEHTFPLLINKNTKEIFVIDALEHITKICPNPKVEAMTWNKISIINDYYTGGGKYLSNNKTAVFKPVEWYKKTPCKFTSNNYFHKKLFLYGIPFKPINISYVFNRSFNNLIVKRLFNSELCSPKLKTLKLKKKYISKK